MPVSSPVWLLDLVAGQTWRFASRTVTWDGNRYTDGLETPGSFADALSFSVPTEASFPVVIQAQHVAKLDMEDIALGATATLYYWQDPDGDDDPVVVISGTVEDPEYGGRDEPLDCSIREVPWDDNGRIPDATARIDLDTWPNYDTDAGIDDEFYPLVIGEPGIDVDTVGSPAYWVQIAATDYVLVAGHPRVASTATVSIYNKTQGTNNAPNLSHVADGLGRIVTVGDITAWGGIAAGDEIWAVWGAGGALPNPEDPTKPLTGAGDLIEYLLHRSTIRVDWGRLRAAKGRLNGYRIDTYLQPGPEERFSAWTWITEHMLPRLPVSVRTGPNGLYLAVFDPTAPVAQARVRLEHGRNCERVSTVAVLGTSDVANDFALSYAPQANKDKGSATVRLTGSTETLDAFDDAYRSAICEESVRRYGVIPREFKTAIVYDQSTAVRMLISEAALTALPFREVTYIVNDEADILDMEPGDLVSLTDSTLGWTDRAASAWTVRVTDPREVTLRLWHQPGRDYSPVRVS